MTRDEKSEDRAIAQREARITWAAPRGGDRA